MTIEMVPHLTTALKGPLYELEKIFLDKHTQIGAWFRDQFQQTPPPLTCSVDVRNAGFKVAPVDTNLFPAGFNNLNKELLPLAIQAMQSVLSEQHPGCKNILLIAEDHTRNTFYLESLTILADIIFKAGYQVKIGSFLPTLRDSDILHPLKREGARVVTADGFNPCLIVSNNDFSAGVPTILDGIEQPIMPPLALSWATRLKSTHFKHYQDVATAFAKVVDIDPWLISPLYRTCSAVDFVNREGEECLAYNTRELLKSIQEKYTALGIERDPFVVIKADSGTYGMGVVTVRDADDIAKMNRKQRQKMSTAKGGQKISQVIIQEGVYTFEQWGEEQAVAEPVVYMVGPHVVGGFYRVHNARGADENLNAPGMNFVALSFNDPCNQPSDNKAYDDGVNRFYTYGVIARLALLAAAKEWEDVK
jgi:glutamate--cysteine ligase